MLDSQLEANLIVALAGAAMADGISAFLQGDLHQTFRNTGSCVTGAQQVLLIDGTGLHGGDDEIVHIFVGEIQHIQLGCAGSQCLFFQTFQFVCLTHIAGNSNDFAVVVVFLQPGDNDGSIQTAGVSEYDFFDGFFIHRYLSSNE